MLRNGLMRTTQEFPFLSDISAEWGLDSDVIIRGFAIEADFRQKILKERDPFLRKQLYADFYRRIYEVYGQRADLQERASNSNDAKRLTVSWFRKELEGCSILDVGCGDGRFLKCVARYLHHKKLVGIDTALPQCVDSLSNLSLLNGDVVDFSLGEEFDIVFSDNVLEHLAPADLDIHLASVTRHLRKGGKFILIMPNRLFGPWDTSRIVDDSHTNKVSAMAGHLNESTYSEMLPILRNAGLANFKTLLQFMPLMRFHHRFPILNSFHNLRISPALYRLVEGSPLLLRTLHWIRLNGKCRLWFLVILVCEKP